MSLISRFSSRLLLIAVLSLGIFFRLAHLDHKIYWYDETFTALRSAGYTEAEVVQHFAAAAIVPVAELNQYQQAAEQKRLADTWYSLAIEDNQHPPLYYTIAHFWGRWVGSSIAAARLLPALWSLLSLWAIYWLCQELFVETGLFQSKLPNWIGVGLLAISPFQIAYAQEARQYSLWSLVTILATAALLRAMRVQTPMSWVIYTLTVILNLYTFLLAGLTVIAHGSYVLLQSKFRLQRSWLAYLSAISVSTIAFSPWLWVLISHLGQAQSVTSWTANHQSLPQLVLTWASIVGRIFYDRGETGLDRLIQLGLIGLVGYAFWFCRRSRCLWLLILLTIVPVLPLLLADLIGGGIRSTFPRYFIPSLLGIQLAVVYLLSAKLLNAKLLSAKLLNAKLLNAKLNHPNSVTRSWQWMTLAVCSAGVVSGIANFSSVTGGYKTLSQENNAVAQVINQSPQVLLVSDAETGDLLSLSHLLQPEVKLLLRPRCYTCQINRSEQLDLFIDSAQLIESIKDYKDVFLFHPRSSKTWQQSLAHHPKVRFESIDLKSDQTHNKVIWRIVNKSPI